MGRHGLGIGLTVGRAEDAEEASRPTTSPSWLHPEAGSFTGAVLCGGQGRRMGRDKALIEVDGRSLAARVGDALAAAGASDVLAIGGDASALAARGLRTVPDDWPGGGPLGGIVTALRAAMSEIVLVAACDLVNPSPTTMAAVVAALDTAHDAAVATPVVDGRRQWAQAAWQRRTAPDLARRFKAGDRAIHRAVAAAALVVIDVAGIDPSSLTDADTPGELPPP